MITLIFLIFQFKYDVVPEPDPLDIVTLPNVTYTLTTKVNLPNSSPFFSAADGYVINLDDSSPVDRVLVNVTVSNTRTCFLRGDDPCIQIIDRDGHDLMGYKSLEVTVTPGMLS